MAVDDQVAVLVSDLASEATVSGVVLEHVDHVVERDEGIVDGDDLDALSQGGSQDNAANSAESVNTNGGHFKVWVWF